MGFLTNNPETAHQVTYLMGVRGLPRTWRNLNGYGSHTYMWINARGEKFWVKYHFHTRQGMAFFTNAEAAAMAETKLRAGAAKKPAEGMGEG